MDSYTDSGENLSTSWIESLALEELNMEETGVINFNSHLQADFHLEESSLRFMDSIRDRMEVYVLKFNELRGHNKNQASIKIFKISNTVNDFMLFRNSLKLIVARKQNDLVSIGFMSNAGGMFAARTHPNPASIQMNHEIKAHVGPFNKITWSFNGEKVDVDALVKHYLTEFIKHSAR